MLACRMEVVQGIISVACSSGGCSTCPRVCESKGLRMIDQHFSHAFERGFFSLNGYDILSENGSKEEYVLLFMPLMHSVTLLALPFHLQSPVW